MGDILDEYFTQGNPAPSRLPFRPLAGAATTGITPTTVVADEEPSEGEQPAGYLGIHVEETHEQHEQLGDHYGDLSDPLTRRLSHLAPPVLTVYSDTGSSRDMEETLSEALDIGSQGGSSGSAGEANRPEFSDSPYDEVVFELGTPELPDEDSDSDRFLQHKKQYFILSSAGKPIYSAHGSDQVVSAYMGVIQTVVAFFESKEEDEDEIQCIRADTTMFVFLSRENLILLAVSSIGESERQLVQQLDLLHSYLISTLSKPQITRVFQNRGNFDLRRLLGKSDTACLDALSFDMATVGNPGILLGALECLYLEKSAREKIHTAMMETRKSSLLYGLLIAPRGRLISILRPKRHKLHTSDLQLLFSMIFNTNLFNQHDGTIKDSGIEDESRENEEFWVPICFPKFNSNGFLHAYVGFLEDSFRVPFEFQEIGNVPKVEKTAVVLISAEKDAFFEMKSIKTKLCERLEKEKLTGRINASLTSGRFTPLDIPIPLVRHFICKHKGSLQFTASSYAPHFTTLKSRRTLNCLYARLHEYTHNPRRMGSTSFASRAAYIKWRGKVKGGGLAGLSWVTSKYELYLVTGSFVRKDMLSQSARAILEWVNRYEERLFVMKGGIF